MALDPQLAEQPADPRPGHPGRPKPPLAEHQLSDPHAPPGAPRASLSPAKVTAIQAVLDHPCVSVLLSTTPAARMTADDAARLRGLLAEARDRLAAEPPGPHLEEVLERLDRVAARATSRPTDAALALYSSASFSDVVRLPVPVRDRVVVDPTFATRDLVRALHHTPRHVVLVLTTTEARLFHGVADTLQPARRSRFPLVAGSARPRRARGEREAVRRRRPRTGKEEADTVAFLRQVDQALGAALRLHPAPLVLVGPERLLATFRGLSRHLDRLAGTVTGSHARAPLHELVTLVRPVLDAYLHSRQEEALALLDRRLGTRQAATGMPEAWVAAHHERPEMLVVEDTLVYPARLSDGGDALVPAADVEAPDVIDDAVDELIEVVLQRGGWVALADEGALATHGGVALTLRDQR